MPTSLTVSSLARMIDHTLLDPAVTEASLDRHCQEAAEQGFATVAINSAPVAYCARRLQGTSVGVCAAVSFPLGQTVTAVKVYEAQRAVEQGATEIDFVINLGLLKSGRVHELEEEIAAVVAACGDVTSKVILETCYLSDGEKVAVTEMAISAGASFVKTSTGRGPRGATLPDVLLLAQVAKGRIRVKAAGGIRTLDEVLSYLDAGATRIGTSQALAILADAREVLPA